MSATVSCIVPQGAPNTLYLSDSLSFTFLLQTGAYPGPYNPLDLTGCSASFGLVAQPYGGTGLSYESTDTTGYVTIPAPINGQVVINIPGSVTSTLAVGAYACAIKITSASGVQTTYGEFIISVLPEICP